MSGRMIGIDLGTTNSEVAALTEDGVIVFPIEAEGQMAVAEGVFTKIELSLDQTKMMEKHRCEEAGEDFDEAKVCTPATLYQIAGLGATIR